MRGYRCVNTLFKWIVNNRTIIDILDSYTTLALILQSTQVVIHLLQLLLESWYGVVILLINLTLSCDKITLQLFHFVLYKSLSSLKLFLGKFLQL